MTLGTTHFGRRFQQPVLLVLVRLVLKVCRSLLNPWPFDNPLT